MSIYIYIYIYIYAGRLAHTVVLGGLAHCGGCTERGEQGMVGEKRGTAYALVQCKVPDAARHLLHVCIHAHTCARVQV